MTKNMGIGKKHRNGKKHQNSKSPILSLSRLVYLSPSLDVNLDLILNQRLRILWCHWAISTLLYPVSLLFGCWDRWSIFHLVGQLTKHTRCCFSPELSGVELKPDAVTLSPLFLPQQLNINPLTKSLYHKKARPPLDIQNYCHCHPKLFHHLENGKVKILYLVFDDTYFVKDPNKW